MGTPAWFQTHIRLSIADRLRVLWHGEIIYRGEIRPDPGEFYVEAKVEIAHVRKKKQPPHPGYSVDQELPRRTGSLPLTQDHPAAQQAMREEARGTF